MSLEKAKKYLEEKGEGSGKVILYGCPGEEGAATKAFMARDGVFAECDAALTWHPGNVNQVTSGTCNTCIQTEYSLPVLPPTQRVRRTRDVLPSMRWSL